MNLYNQIDQLPKINKSTLKVGDYLVEVYSGFPDSHIYEVIEIDSDLFIATIVGSVDANGISSLHYISDNETHFTFNYIEGNEFVAAIPKENDSVIKKILVFS